MIVFLLFQTILCRVLYPRVLRRVVTQVRQAGFFSVSFVREAAGLCCYISVWDGNVLKHVCVLWEPLGLPFGEAELRCLSRFLCCLPREYRPLVVRGCSSVFVSGYNRWVAEGKMLLNYQEFSQKLFRDCIQTCSMKIFGRMGMFSVIDFLVWRLVGALDEVWLLTAVWLRDCVIARRVHFEDLCGVVTELLTIWPHVMDFLFRSVNASGS